MTLTDDLSVLTLERFIAATGDLIVVVYATGEKHGTIAELNPAALKRLGYQREEIIGKHVTLLHPEELRNGFCELIARQADDKEPFTNFPLQTRDGCLVPVETKVVNGEWRGERVIIGICHDVSDRMKATAAAAESERKFQAIFDSANDAICVMDGERFLDCNQKAEAVFQMSRERLVGARPEMLSPDIQPDGQKSSELARLKIEAALSGKPQRFEWMHYHGDGTPFEAEVSLSRVHLQGKHYLLAILRDITERKRSEVSMSQSQLRLRAFLDNMPFEFWACDAGRRVVFQSNKSLEVWGDVRGKVLDELPIPEPVKSRVIAGCARAMMGEVLTGESQMKLNGKDVSFLHVLGPMQISAEGKNSIEILGVNIDLSQQKRMEDEKRKLEQHVQQMQKLESLGVLAGGIAHDFNNILVAVMGHADIALRRILPGSPVKDSLDKIINAAGKASDLARQMLAYSGKGSFIVQAVDVRQLTNDMMQMIGVAVSKRAQLKIEFPNQISMVRADATQLRQVLMNLVINASESLGDRDGVIRLSAGESQLAPGFMATWNSENLKPGRYVWFQVEDSGEGMAPETIARIFDPFFTTKFTGRGMGLPAVLGIVRSHGGAIDVKSAVGKGSVFRIYLPATNEVSSSSPSTEPAAVRQPAGGMILLVDDEIQIRETASEMLKELGYTPLVAEDGCKALTLYKQHEKSIRAVLLDLMMPRMDGCETFRELRKLGKSVPVVLCSAYSEVEVKEKFKHGELAGFIPKPFRLETLAQVLSEILK